MLQRLLHGDDIFISYSRADGDLYAAGLADELTKLGYSCFIDHLGTEPNVNLPSPLKRKLKSCTVCVLVGTKRALASEFVAEEIKEFKTTRRTIIPVYFVADPEQTALYKVIPGLARVNESPDALVTGDPSDQVVNRVVKSFSYARRNQRLGRLAGAAAVLLLLLLGGGVAAGAYAGQKLREAGEAQREAERQKGEAEKQKALAETATAEAEKATAEATKARDEASRQEALALKQTELARRNGAEAKRQQGIARAKEAEAKRQGEIAQAKAKEAAEKAAEAQRQTERARREQTKAGSQNVASNARSLLEYDPERSVLLAAHAVKMLGDAALERPPLTEDVLRRALATSSARAILTPDNAPPPFSEKVVRTRGAAFSRDGRLAVTATTKGAEVWDTKTGRRLAQSGSVYGSEFSFTSDGSAVLWGGSNQVNVWDWGKGGHAGKKLEAPDSPAPDIHNSSFSDDGKVVAVEAGKRVAHVKDVDTGRVLAELRHEYEIGHANFSPGGRFVYTSAASAKDAPRGLVQVWGIDGRPQGTVRTEGQVDLVALSPTGRRLATYDREREVVELWDVAKGERVATLDVAGTRLRIVKFGPDGRLLAAGGDGDAARVWDGESGSERAVLAKQGAVRGLDFSPDGTLLATASDDAAAHVWHTATWQRMLELRGHSGPVSEVAFSPDGGRLLLTLSEDGSGRLWDASPDRRPVTELRPETLRYSLGGRYLNWVGFSPDGRSLLTSAAGVEVWDTATGQRASQPSAGSRGPIAYSRDWRLYVAAPEGAGAPKVFEAKTGREVSKLNGEHYPRYGAVFDPEGKVLVVTLSERARVWDVATGRLILYIHGNRFENERYPHVYDAAFSPDGGLFAFVTDAKAELWDARKWEKVTDLPKGGSKLRYFGVAFSPDGRTLAAAGLGLTLWDVATGERLAHLSPDRRVQTTNGVAFSPDGRLVAAANSDGTTQVWEWRTGRRVNVLNDGARPTRDVRFSPDGRLLLTASDDGVVRLYPREMFLPFEELSALIPQRVGRGELTGDERKRYLPADETPKPAPTP